MLRDENNQIFYYLQSLPTKASIAEQSLWSLFRLEEKNAPLDHQVLICVTHVLLWLCQFWNQLQGKLVHKETYQAGIRGLRLCLQGLQLKNPEAQNMRKPDLKEGWKEIQEILHWEGLPYIPEIVRIKLINRHHDNPLASHFEIKKT